MAELLTNVNADLSDPEVLSKDADVLDAWAEVAERHGGRFGLARRAAAALREVADLQANVTVLRIAGTVAGTTGRLAVEAPF